MIGNIVLPIFFLYFVLISGYCSAILNCGLQRFMRDSIYFKHFLILLSIYIFTFILNWYTFDSLSISQLENFEDSKQMKLSYESLKKLGLWFLYSIAIYLLFLLSTKSEVTYILIFFAFTVLAIIVQIILKSISSSSYGNLANKMIITSKDYNGKNKNSIIIAHNCLTIGFFIAFLLLCVGFYKYFNRQWIDHAHHWSTEKFLFGTSKCSDD
tara:strand:+ start:2765 stop:3400 length:636 start_codon:yes stop_codon:yes gene_type:complete